MSLQSAAFGARRVFGMLAVAFATLAGGGAAALAETWPATLRAVYDVNFNGFNVGTFEFQSEAEQRSYTLAGNARLSILLGAITWDGATRSFGLFANQGPKPAAFSFDFKSNTKAGSTKIGFADGSVTRVTHLPPAIAKPGTIPVREHHLKGVLDPLSAIIAISRVSDSNPCDRRVPIFDGKERFDLLLSYKGEMKVSEQQPSGQPGIAYVCRVRYLPIAGHKADSETQFMAANDSIEVALRPIPSANLLVPYHVNIPTMAGYATVVSKRVEIISPGKPQIALTH
jgi:hypothetical protein